MKISNISDKVDWEVELAAVIGKPGPRRTGVEGAVLCGRLHLCQRPFGARPRPAAEHQRHRPVQADWTKHKSFDGSCPLGPWIVPASEIRDPQNLGIKLWVNGVLKQDSNSKHMIFNLAEQIAQLSSGMTLQPGDLILTGTPAGVGAARGEFLKKGDVVKIWIEKVGELTNQMA